jgi:hypothetical protein
VVDYPAVSGRKGEQNPVDTRRVWRLGACYLAAACVGYVAGFEELLPIGPLRASEASTPLSRVGFALRERNAGAAPQDYARLADDLAAVRSKLPPELQGVFELVFAVRGLSSGGAPDLTRAAELCRSLKWQRCDRASLEELGRRSTP